MGSVVPPHTGLPAPQAPGSANHIPSARVSSQTLQSVPTRGSSLESRTHPASAHKLLQNLIASCLSFMPHMQEAKCGSSIKSTRLFHPKSQCPALCLGEREQTTPIWCSIFTLLLSSFTRDKKFKSDKSSKRYVPKETTHMRAATHL